MKKQPVAGLVLSLLLATSSGSASQLCVTTSTHEGRQITIQVFDYAGIESANLLRAERVAENVLRDSGLDTVWVVCLAAGTWSKDAVCGAAPSPMQFNLIMLPHSMVERRSPRSGTFGFALEDGEDGFGCRASVFYDRVKDLVEQRGLSLAQLLGTVIAHELGHLLLGANSHSGMGLMSARWSSRELAAAQHGGLFFSSSESERLQKAVDARWRAAAGGVQNAMLQPRPISQLLQVHSEK